MMEKISPSQAADRRRLQRAATAAAEDMTFPRPVPLKCSKHIWLCHSTVITIPVLEGIVATNFVVCVKHMIANADGGPSVFFGMLSRRQRGGSACAWARE